MSFCPFSREFSGIKINHHGKCRPGRSGGSLDFFFLIIFISEYIYSGPCSIVVVPQRKAGIEAGHTCRDDGFFLFLCFSDMPLHSRTGLEKLRQEATLSDALKCWKAIYQMAILARFQVLS